MEKTGLIPNKSYDIFILGDNIVNYLHLPHHMKCYWQDKNLIKMFYKEFLTLINYQQSDSDDFVYVPISRDRGQNQRVHYFDNLGLTLWVWREKIRTILIYNYKDE